MAATLTSASNILKEVYAPRIREQLNDSAVALKRVESSNSGISTDTATGGKYVTFPIHTRRNAGQGSRLEMEALPGAGQQGYASARIGLHSHYASIQLTGPVLRMTNTDPKAFAKALDEEVTRVKNDVNKEMNRQVYADGTGAIGVVKTAGTGVNTFAVVDGRAFQLGELVDIVTLPNTVAVSSRTVNAIDLTAGANTVTLSGATFNVAVGQIVTRQGSGPAASGNREITGFGAIVSSSGVLYNVDPSVEPVWKSVIYSNGGTNRALNEGLMTQLADDIYTNGGSTSLMLTSLGVRRSYANLLTQTRSTVNTQKFTGGFSGLAFTTDRGDIPLVSDVDAPLNRIWYINEDALTYYRPEEWNWLDMDGSQWKQVTDSNGVYDAWRAYLTEDHELGTDRRNTHGQLQDIIES